MPDETLRWFEREEPSHWYYPDGTPCHTVKRKDGHFGPTHAGDALELGLLPSTTNIIGVLDKPAIRAWEKNRILTAAFGVNPEPYEVRADFAGYAERVDAEAFAPRDNASEFGTGLHRAIEQYLKAGWPADLPHELTPYLSGFIEWWHDQHIEARQVEATATSVHEGVGGTIDLVAWDGETFAIDWKTQAFDCPDEEPARGRRKAEHYPEWNVQIACYDMLHELGTKPHRTVVFSSKVPGLVSVRNRTAEETREALLNFRHIRNLFYSPLGKGKNLPKPAAMLEAIL